MAGASKNADPGRQRRRSVTELAAEDLGRLRIAIRAAQGDGRYRALAEHAARVPITRPRWPAPARFLAENRLRLRTFEEHVLQGWPLAVWDWTATPQIPQAFLDDAGIRGSGNPLQATAIDGSPRATGAPEHGGSTTRDPGAGGARLPTAREVAQLLSIAELETFSDALMRMNSVVHVWVGGHMSQVLYAPFDPLFWFHRAMIDRIWWSWQLEHSAAMPAEIADDRISPRGPLLADVWDPADLTYDYDPIAEPAPRMLAGARNDRPAAVDALGFRHYATAFAEVIAAPSTEAPLTIGIFGSWGMGKSTLLDSIVREVEGAQASAGRDGASGAPFIHAVRFNAWDYTAEEAIWPALVRTVMEQIDRDIEWPWWRRFGSLFRRNLRRTLRLHGVSIAVAAGLLLLAGTLAVAALDFDPPKVGAALLALGFSGVIKLVGDTVSNPTGRWIASLFRDGDYGRRIGTLETIREDLAFLERRLQGESSRARRVLIVIDDLDRCEPDKAVEVLQAINRLLDFDSFIVCMGIDARIVTAAIESHYEGLLAHAGASGYEYLDKIIQIPFRIPEPDADELGDFLAAHLPLDQPILDPGPLPSPGEPLDEAQTDADAPGASLAYTAPESKLDLSGALGQRVAFTQDELDAFVKLREYLRPNPRHVKRLINVYRLVRTLAESKLREPHSREEARLLLDNPDATIRWLLLSAQWPYTARTLMARGRTLARAADGVPPHGALAGRATLRTLLESVRGAQLTEGQRDYDDDTEQLEMFIGDCDVTWHELRVICEYTINFNPAVEERLQRLAAAASA